MLSLEPCVRSGFPDGTNGIPISFKVLPMVPLVIPFVPMVMPMVQLAFPMVQLVPLVSQWYHWLPEVPLVKLPMVPLGEPRTEPFSSLFVLVTYSPLLQTVNYTLVFTASDKSFLNSSFKYLALSVLIVL